jgi:Xaa-Pro aminopeptidase
MDHPGRAARVGSRLEELGADALLVTNLTNVRYLTGFAGSNGQVLVAPGQTVFLTDPRYAARAADLVEGAEIAIYKDKLTDLLPEMLGALNVKRLGVEAATMSLAQRDELSDKLAVELVATAGAVEDLRRVKERAEIELIRAAADLADQTFAWALDHIAPGVMERDVALELEMRIRKEGAEAVPFEPIVGSGQLSAHIHHTPSERVLSKGDLVLLDFGMVVRVEHETRARLISTVMSAVRQDVDGVIAGFYELGLLDAWAAGDIAQRRWVLGAEPRCPEARCRHNGQAGALPLGEAFPSGHVAPPVHPGCTCTTLPALEPAESAEPTVDA